MAVLATLYNIEVGPKFRLPATGGIKAGDLVYHNGTRLVQADADSLTAYAQFVVISGEAIVNDDPVTVAFSGIFTDADLSLTAGGALYLSATAGAVTGTRPTTDAQLRQVVGVALTATSYYINLKGFHEVQTQGELMETTSGEAALGSRTALASGTYEGIQLNAQNEYITWLVRVPENAVALVKAIVESAEDTAPSGSPTFSFTVNSAIDDAAWNAVTADTSEATKDINTASAADDIGKYDAVAAFNATSIVRPGALLTVKMLKADTGTDAILIFGLTLTWRCV